MINLFSKTDDFIENDKFVSKKWKGVKSEKIKVFPLVCSKYLSSWTGPDMTEVRFMESRGGPEVTEVRVLVQFDTFRLQKWYFDEMT